jgi:hypothetical protein
VAPSSEKITSDSPWVAAIAATASGGRSAKSASLSRSGSGGASAIARRLTRCWTTIIAIAPTTARAPKSHWGMESRSPNQKKDRAATVKGWSWITPLETVTPSFSIEM